MIKLTMCSIRFPFWFGFNIVTQMQLFNISTNTATVSVHFVIRVILTMFVRWFTRCLCWWFLSQAVIPGVSYILIVFFPSPVEVVTIWEVIWKRWMPVWSSIHDHSHTIYKVLLHVAVEHPQAWVIWPETDHSVTTWRNQDIVFDWWIRLKQFWSLIGPPSLGTDLEVIAVTLDVLVWLRPSSCCFIMFSITDLQHSEAMTMQMYHVMSHKLIARCQIYKDNLDGLVDRKLVYVGTFTSLSITDRLITGCYILVYIRAVQGCATVHVLTSIHSWANWECKVIEVLNDLVIWVMYPILYWIDRGPCLLNACTYNTYLCHYITQI